MKIALSVLTLQVADAAQTKLSPVTRVVELLKGIQASVESEVKKEEDLYESFVCWGNAVVDAKTASNAAATSRIDNLNQYISDLDAGRIELTSERKDLEKEMAGAGVDEKNAQADYEKFLADAAAKRAKDSKLVGEKEGAKAEAQASLEGFTEDKVAATKELGDRKSVV